MKPGRSENLRPIQLKENPFIPLREKTFAHVELSGEVIRP